MTQPTKWSAPLGSGADVQELPDDDLRYASFSKIFPQITQVPLSAGGVAPRRIDFNSLFKLLADNIYYYQNGGVFEYSDTGDYEKGALVRYNDKIYLCIQDNSALNTHNPEDMNYWLKVALNNELGIITGEIKYFAFNTPPEGYLVCNGANVSRETYADLYAIIGTTFGSGDDSTTFALPNLIDKFAQGSTIVGTAVEAGLPNITGWTLSASTTNSDPAYYSGALSTQDIALYRVTNSGTLGYTKNQLNFDASKSNPIYGNSTTVQPPALTLLPCIKY